MNGYRTSRLFIILTLILFFSLMIAAMVAIPGVRADSTWTVCSSGCDFNNIENAVLNASAGDTIILAAETFPENVIIDKTLSLAGASKEGTIIDGQGLDRGVYIKPNIVVTITNLTISNGSVDPDEGGGLLNDHGTVVLNKLVISNNDAHSGGGISNYGTLTMTNSYVADNSATNGGGIINNINGKMTIENSTVISNSGELGGGINNGGIMTVRGSTIANNDWFEGCGIANIGEIVIVESTLTGNNGFSSGGILNWYSGVVFLSNSTVSDNEVHSQGAGIYNSMDAKVIIDNSTVSHNVSHNAGDYGSGIYNIAWVDGASISNSIIANNTGEDCSGKITQTNGFNMDSDGTCQTSITADPLLDSLQDNGGPTFTRALSETSPAIDAGQLLFCLETDQRGKPRPQGNGCDLGAYEYGPSPSLTANHTFGAPGSYFSLLGLDFPANSAATILINNISLGTMMTSSGGSLDYAIATEKADEGLYVVTTSVNPSVSSSIFLKSDWPVQAKTDNEVVYKVPEGIALTPKRIFYPFAIMGELPW